MQIFTHKTRQVMEPAPATITMDATGLQYTTPSTWAVKLGGLAHLQVLEGAFIYDLRLSGASAGGSATVRLMQGATVVGSETVDLSTDTRFTGRVDVDLTGTNGAAPLTASVVVDTAADAAVTAELFAALDLSGPLVVSGC